jgi:peptidoglycan L-alanyl-D-glutamate endopeptidase CwlK
MGYKYSAASLSHLSGVTPKLRKVFETAINIVNITILDGIRTKAEQEQNLRTGASQTMNSRHLPQPPDNLSAAVDAVVWPTDWDLLERGFQAVKRADPQLRILEHFWMMGVLKGIAYTQGVDLRQGIDWNGNGEFDDQTFMDMDHSEIRK